MQRRRGSRLPWGKKLKFLSADPGPIWPIVDALKDDSEEYVRQSVANNLNDIAKDHPEATIAFCRRLIDAPTASRTRIVNHTLRSLIKDGEPAALQVVGFGPPKGLSSTLTATPTQVAPEDKVVLRAEVSSASTRAQNLVIDYVVYFMRKNGGASPKVFKSTTLEIPGKTTLTFNKTHPLRITTIRALYPGTHEVAIQVNGVQLARTSFELL
ncbi:MAG: hypothetical protein HOI95_06605 [Chromatiales bacterium]|nr:hypothetical protein [Chromatiales bacterium]